MKKGHAKVGRSTQQRLQSARIDAVVVISLVVYGIEVKPVPHKATDHARAAGETEEAIGMLSATCVKLGLWLVVGGLE